MPDPAVGWQAGHETQRDRRGRAAVAGADQLQVHVVVLDLEQVAVAAVALQCGADQVVEDGYEFFSRRQLVTLFSAPNYCGEFDNSGALMSIDDTLMCSF